VSHGRASGAGADETFVNHENPQAFGGKFQRARGTHNTGADYHDFGGSGHG
jgi:hypothetical protein